MICYAVIDTNVLVSSLLTSKDDASTIQVIQRLVMGEFIPLLNEEILNEYDEVLHRPKFNFQEDAISWLLDLFTQTGLFIHSRPSGKTLIDMKDLPFYEVVLSKPDENSFLVTGNTKHFPKESFIVTPNEFLDILDSSKEQN